MPTNQTSNIVGNISKEYYNQNIARSFPFRDSAGGAIDALPSSLFVGGLLLYSASTTSVEFEYLYISKLTVGVTGFSMDITGVTSSDKDIAFRDCISAGFDSDINAEIEINSTALDENGVGYTLTGVLVLGDPLCIKDYPAVTEWSTGADQLPATAFSSDVVWSADKFGIVTGIKVGDDILTGLVELNAGDGIDISLTGSTITISAVDYDITGGTITDDATLLDAVVNLYGRPITTINGMGPDTNGNMTITGPINCASSVGTIRVQLNEPLCMHEDFITRVDASIVNLNDKAATIVAAINELDSAINSMSVQLTRIGQ